MSAVVALLIIVLPVFLVVASGFLAVRARVFPDAGIDALISFATNIAVPVLLFRSIYGLDLGANLRLAHLGSFYLAATVCFGLGIIAVRMVCQRRPGEAVAIGFSALFSNSVLLGLPVFERAYGADAMEPVFAIIAFHAGFCYLLGIVVMELARRDGTGIGGALVRSAKAIFRNALTLSILVGFAFNLFEIPIPRSVGGMLEMLASAALPVALFGLGGVLTRYRLGWTGAEPWIVASLSLVLHPALAYLLTARVFALDDAFVRAAVLIAAMPPGVNGYLFAAMYGRMVGAAASTVLLTTILSLVTITVWLWFLGGAAIG